MLNQASGLHGMERMTERIPLRTDRTVPKCSGAAVKAPIRHQAAPGDRSGHLGTSSTGLQSTLRWDPQLHRRWTTSGQVEHTMVHGIAVAMPACHGDCTITHGNDVFANTNTW
jgi:hypothetical protein